MFILTFKDREVNAGPFYYLNIVVLWRFKYEGEIVNKELTYQYCDNQTGSAFEKAIPLSVLAEVKVEPLDESGIDYAEQVPLRCYDNVINTLLKNPESEPELRLCLGLQQDVSETEKVVEHCWIERLGEFYDSSAEIANSKYYLFCSLSLSELLVIMEERDIEFIPNIETLRSFRNKI